MLAALIEDGVDGVDAAPSRVTDAEMDSQSPFALLLVGQPTLARQLRLGVFAAYVAPRIMSRSFQEPDPEGGARG